jgi:hypothetical protein
VDAESRQTLHMGIYVSEPDLLLGVWPGSARSGNMRGRRDRNEAPGGYEALGQLVGGAYLVAGEVIPAVSVEPELRAIWEAGSQPREAEQGGVEPLAEEMAAWEAASDEALARCEAS